MPKAYPSTRPPKPGPREALRILKLRAPQRLLSPATCTAHASESYSVTLELSRNVTNWEQQAVKGMGDDVRLNGSRLVLHTTTLKDVKHRRKQLRDLVSEVERIARLAQGASKQIADRHEAVQHLCPTLLNGCSHVD